MAQRPSSRSGGSPRRSSSGRSRSSSGRSSSARSSSARSSSGRSSSARSSSGRSSSGRSSSRSSRGGRGRPPARGGGSNATAIGVGIVLLIGVIAVIAVMSGKKKKRPVDTSVSELTADSQLPEQEQRPQEPERPPPPEISDEIISEAKAVVEEAQVEKEKADAHYDEAMAARQAGDEKTWQAKLEEAREHYVIIREMWNERIVAEIDGELPMGCDYDADEVANHWIGREAGKITKMLEQMGSITKQMRMK